MSRLPLKSRIWAWWIWITDKIEGWYYYWTLLTPEERKKLKEGDGDGNHS